VAADAEALEGGDGMSPLSEDTSGPRMSLADQLARYRKDRERYAAAMQQQARCARLAIVTGRRAHTRFLGRVAIIENRLRRIGGRR
jgi:hypothetical protein